MTGKCLARECGGWLLLLHCCCRTIGAEARGMLLPWLLYVVLVWGMHVLESHQVLTETSALPLPAA